MQPDPVDRVARPKKADISLPKGWQLANDALDRIESVSTIFPDFNRATRCGGYPVNRIHTIHGPTHGGKTSFLFGLMKSFVDGGHYAAYVDAEHATPQEFAAELFGELSGNDHFLARRPKTYEDTIDATDAFLSWMTEKRKSEPGLKCIVAIDSINKLQPNRELKNILKAGGDEVAKGHAGRYRAALNQSWLNHLSPRLAAAGCAMTFIAQERDDSDSDVWAPEGQVSIKGGQALSFDASLLIRVSKQIPVWDQPKKEAGADSKHGDIVGFKHRVRIYKSKVSHMDGNYTDCVFHMSNGKHTPAGFDIQRDALLLAKNLELITVSGSWLTWGKRRWQGEMRASGWLADNQPALAELLGQISKRLEQDRQRGK